MRKDKDNYKWAVVCALICVVIASFIMYHNPPRTYVTYYEDEPNNYTGPSWIELGQYAEQKQFCEEVYKGTQSYAPCLWVKDLQDKCTKESGYLCLYYSMWKEQKV